MPVGNLYLPFGAVKDRFPERRLGKLIVVLKI
jgi:hypothetical protein